MTFFFCQLTSFSQTTKADSLLILMQQQNTDAVNLDLLNSLSFEYWDVNPIEGLKYAKQALLLAEKINSKQGIAEAYANIGRSYRRMTNITKALEFSFKSLKLYEELNDKHGIAGNLLNIGNAYRVQKDFDKALEYLFKALKINEDLNDMVWVARCLNSIGNVYKDKKDYKNTLNYYSRSLKIAEAIKDKDRITAATTNLGSVYGLMKNYDQALKCDIEALKMYKVLGKKIGISECYINLAMVYLDIYKDKGLKANIDLARDYCDSAIVMDTEAGHLEGLQWDYKFQTTVLSEIGDHKGALKSYAYYVVIKDSISNEESNRRIAQLEKNNEEDLKQKEIEIQKLQLLSAKKERLFFILGLICVAVFAGLILRTLLITRKQKSIIEKQKKVVEDHQKEILDSIHYAKRIQTSLLPPEKYIAKHLNDKKTDNK